MRYAKGHKDLTRRKIVETAAARFRRDGIDAVGVADLMAEAGLTHGGFYSHFKSKEDLVRAAMDEASAYSFTNFQTRTTEGGLERWIRGYMSDRHRDHPEAGCVVAALGSELARRPASSRRDFTGHLRRVIHEIGAHLPADLTPAQRRKTAAGIFATLTGSMQMARAVVDEKLSEEILQAGVSSALALARIKSA